MSGGAARRDRGIAREASRDCGIAGAAPPAPEALTAPAAPEHPGAWTLAEPFYLRSGAARPPLRVGLLVDSFLQPAWVDRILDQIERCAFARLELVVTRSGDGIAPRPGPLGRAARLLADPALRSGLLYSLYDRLDRRRYAPADDALRPVDCGSRLARLPRLEVAPLARGAVHRFPPEAVAAIRTCRLDVLLRFGFGILKGGILAAARYGVWSFHHGDNDVYRGGPPHFWEVIEKRPVSGVVLQVLNEELDAGLVLRKALLPTRHDLSATLNRQLPYWTGSSFVIQKFHDLHRYGWDHLLQHAVPGPPAGARPPIRRPPTNAEMARLLLPRAAGRVLARPWRRRAAPRWRIAVRPGEPRGPRPGADLPPRGFSWIEPPRGHEYADPFLLRYHGRTWVFFEDYDHGEGRGVIACAELLADGRSGPARVVLRLPYHASFPFVFEDEGAVYMIPETGANRTVELFRAERFPDAWRREAVLFSGVRAVDTVLWREGGRYWFFVTLIDPPQAGPQLFLFHTSSLRGRWIPHPANPIAGDARFARAAGAIVARDGMRIRPAQDCSRGYGTAVHFRAITTLSVSAYEERHLWTLAPGRDTGLSGIHTYNLCPTAEAVDGRTEGRGRPPRPWRAPAPPSYSAAPEYSPKISSAFRARE
jgi:hypothetical protein